MNELIVSDKQLLPTFQIAPKAEQLRAVALRAAYLIDEVTNADENAVAVRAQIELKRVVSLFEKSRKAMKEPLLEAGRKLDRLAAAESLELEKEYGRLTQAVSEFQLIEQRRVREEERLQQEEIARIEREKQAELARIAAEQAAREAEAKRIQDEADRKVRESREAAEALAAAATNKKQREAAELARQESLKKQALAEVERQKQAAALTEQQAVAKAAAAKIEETAAAATYVESRPVQLTRQAGQLVKTDWEITVTNPWELAKFHPDCVKIEPLLTPIKAALNEGRTVKGISATKKTISHARTGPERAVIEI